VTDIEKVRPYDAIVIGTSAGGMDALSVILPAIDGNLPVPILIVQHIRASSDFFMVTYFDRLCSLKVVEGTEKAPLEAGLVYFAPPDYHLLVEEDQTLSLSNDEKVNFSRPSIDVLFETACWVFGSRLIGIILTGANSDGSRGLEQIGLAGGLTIVQNPLSASVPRMPEAALKRSKPGHVLNLDEIGPFINQIFGMPPGQ
jgi:two-component system chemotaxis response regulator CheB